MAEIKNQVATEKIIKKNDIKAVAHVCPECHLVAAYRPAGETVMCVPCRVVAVPNPALVVPK